MARSTGRIQLSQNEGEHMTSRFMWNGDLTGCSDCGDCGGREHVAAARPDEGSVASLAAGKVISRRRLVELAFGAAGGVAFSGLLPPAPAAAAQQLATRSCDGEALPLDMVGVVHETFSYEEIVEMERLRALKELAAGREVQA